MRYITLSCKALMRARERRHFDYLQEMIDAFPHLRIAELQSSVDDYLFFERDADGLIIEIDYRLEGGPGGNTPKGDPLITKRMLDKYAIRYTMSDMELLDVAGVRTAIKLGYPIQGSTSLWSYLLSESGMQSELYGLVPLLPPRPKHRDVSVQFSDEFWFEHHGNAETAKSAATKIDHIVNVFGRNRVQLTTGPLDTIANIAEFLLQYSDLITENIMFDIGMQYPSAEDMSLFNAIAFDVDRPQTHRTWRSAGRPEISICVRDPHELDRDAWPKARDIQDTRQWTTRLVELFLYLFGPHVKCDLTHYTHLRCDGARDSEDTVPVDYEWGTARCSELEDSTKALCEETKALFDKALAEGAKAQLESMLVGWKKL